MLKLVLQLICCSPPLGRDRKLQRAAGAILRRQDTGKLVVLLPKSKIRFQLVFELRFTQAMIVMPPNGLTMPAGKVTYCCDADESAN